MAIWSEKYTNGSTEEDPMDKQIRRGKTDGWTDRQRVGGTDRSTDGQTARRIDGKKTDGQTVGWMNDWTDNAKHHMQVTRNIRVLERRSLPQRNNDTGYVSTDKINVFVPVECVYSVNAYSKISTVPCGSERSE